MSDEQADIVGEHADESVEEPESADKAKARQGDGAEADYEDETETEARSNDETEAEGTAAVVERVADADPEAIAAEITSLRTRVDDLELELEEAAVERDDLESRLKRKQAEFQNYKKRQKKRREQERARATEDLVQRLLEVRDNLNRALDVDEETDIRGGVEATLRLLDDVLGAENVEPIEPEPGTEVDPQRHEVLLQVESDQRAGTVDAVHRPGYEMAEKVLRAAQVTVSEEN